MENLGELLKRKREEKGVTLREVEKRTEISNAYLSQLENQKIVKPSPTILKKLAEVYETSYPRLMKVSGYPIETESTKMVYFRTSRGLEDLTKGEERELVDYLKFLRQRRSGK